ncbi:MAG: B12-binding domain-containing radical SAM protein [Flavobacteriales bacterium]|nr:B12-binding domain-containing radical SAM protein [Flavobacteriales bacterium]
MNGTILFNPRSAKWKSRLPNSILQVGASIHGKRDYVFVDGNREEDPWKVIEEHLLTGRYRYFGTTVMPGPQLRQAIPFAKLVRERFPNVINIWGGYFAANQHKVVLASGHVDHVFDGPADAGFPLLLDALDRGSPLDAIPNLIHVRDGAIIRNAKAALADMDGLPEFPYDHLDAHYPLAPYLANSYLGTRTIAYHSSFGCPFTCGFCAVVPIYNARWKGMGAERIHRDIVYLKERWGANAIEFHDNNFFVNEKRTVHFSKLVGPENMGWWGEGRIDTIDKYSDDSLALMRDAGCRMIFFGAESGDDAELKRMDKGGTQSGAQILRFAERMRRVGIVPEYSFVLGFPAPTEREVLSRIDRDIAFIRKVKDVNPDTEIIIYVYSPVPVEGSDLYERTKAEGFRFPERLEDWLDPQWENFDLRKNPLTPWLTPKAIDRIRDFETVLNGRYPTVTDVRLSPAQRSTIRTLSALRYRTGMNRWPYEIKALQKLWRYRQPETEGFPSK